MKIDTCSFTWNFNQRVQFSSRQNEQTPITYPITHHLPLRQKINHTNSMSFDGVVQMHSFFVSYHYRPASSSSSSHPPPHRSRSYQSDNYANDEIISDHNFGAVANCINRVIPSFAEDDAGV
jgi:hypothetical protein